jgi:stage II sporulation protein D
VTVTPAGGGTTTVLATGRMYRGHIVALARQGFRLVDVLDIEQYLQGLGEVPAGWPLAALRTQAVAARTYALRAVSAGHPLGYDVCDDTRCQVYLGVQAESARDAQAARDTRGEVVTYRGALADTFYSANAGGLTATPAEGFGGSTTIPYLPGGLPAPGGVAPWRISAAPQDVARRLAYPGRLDSVVVTGKGPSGRVTRLRLEGAAGPRELTGVDAARRLGLRSTLFTVSRGSGTAQQLPAPGAAATQLPPAEAATALALPTPSPSASPSATSQASTARRPDQLGAWPVSIAAVLVALAGFGVVLSRRADLARPRTGP